ncbi:hypothetical protein BDY21DRAFT_353799 [Lineolata rhizophorae]|uniref:Annexin n=1 Tax=Lineolata rhizophorae TaxID=578093 RepID=A0A6A6NRT9_9PEZI|nr:hypothetical protein BDY21DRAFT_353799 [Lineolata rhizophorae]
MSYYPPPHNQPQYPVYPGGSPQPGYHQPPPPSGSPYPPPQTNSPYPPPQGSTSPYPPHQGSYAPPPGPPPSHMQGQQQYPPPGGYPPPQQYPGYPPPGQYQQPPPQGYPPPQQPYGAPPQGYPPPQQPYGAPPHGYPPPGQHPPQQSYGPPTPPSPGYVPGQMAPVNMEGEAEALRKAMRGFGTDENALIRILSRPDPLQMATLRQTYDRRFARNLVQDLEKETSGWLRATLVALARGPLEQDVRQVFRAIDGAGTKESILNDVLLGRSNADLNAIKGEYARLYRGRSLEQDVFSDLSGKTEQLFRFVLAAQRAEDSAPLIPQQIEQDVTDLQRATEGVKLGSDAATVCQILATRSDGQLRAISQTYMQRYHKPLERVIKSEMHGHMEDALLTMLGRAVDRVKFEADALEDSMKGMGTKDELLVNRVVRCHWNRDFMGQVKRAYAQFHRRDLVSRVKGETSGDYERALVACMQ